MCEPTLNRNSAVQHFERSDSVEIHDRIIYNFYTGLSHVHSFIYASVAAAADYAQNCVCAMCACLLLGGLLEHAHRLRGLILERFLFIE